MQRLFHGKSLKYLGTTVISLVFFMFVGLGAVAAHGYIEQPKSRGLLCNEQVNTNCGGVQWEPQSLEAPKGFPGVSISDGEIASAGGGFS